MQRIFPVGVYAPIRYIIVIAVLVLPGWQIMYGQDTNKLQGPGNLVNLQIQYVKTVSWNILFRNNSDHKTRERAISNVKDSLTRYYLLNYPNIIPVFDPVVYCPCDSLLYNLTMSFINGSGGSVSSPPPAKPGPDGSGDYVAIQHISNNNLIEQMEPEGKPDTPHIKRSITVSLFGKNYHNNSVLAVIDTGIDTTLFSPNFSKLLWRSSQAKTMYNFLPHQNLYNLSDDHVSRHGSLVTALALKAYATGVIKPIYPRIMILKALDANKRGSVFSVSCALSYARQNKATVVNASLGYYGEFDPVLLYYIKRCNNTTGNPILIFAAAGNMRGERNDAILCDPSVPNNKLTSTNTFFPASWSPQLNHILSITGLGTSISSCYYQNYSNKIVSLGVLNIIREHGQVQGKCCSYKAPFSEKYYEGSSFATPVAAGLLMRYMVNNHIGTKQLLHEMAAVGVGPIWNIIHRGAPRVTKDGKYVVFPVKL